MQYTVTDTFDGKRLVVEEWQVEETIHELVDFESLGDPEFVEAWREVAADWRGHIAEIFGGLGVEIAATDKAKED